MKDKNGVELKPGDLVKVEYEAKVHRRIDADLVVSHPCTRGGYTLVPEPAVTKIEPPWVWSADWDTYGNTRYTCTASSGHRCIYTVLRNDEIQFQTSDAGGTGYFRTLEEAKAFVEAYVRGDRK